MSRGEAGMRGGGIVTLRDGDQPDICGRALRLGRGARHRRFDLDQVSCDVRNA
jgi:hypothetical protein